MTVKPMLAEPQHGTDITTLVGTHAFDVKLDGVRSIATWDLNDQGVYELRLTNRSGRDQTVSYPDLAEHCPLPEQTLVLDGEIIALSGSFEDVARRDKQTKPQDVVRVTAQVPVQFLAFDLLQMGDVDMRSWPWSKRRAMLEMVMAGRVNTRWGVTLISNDPIMFEKVRELGLEGVIAKRMDSPYRAGRRPDWVKFKVTHRVTCVAVGYEPGEGSRAHFGAMHLAMVDESGKVVEVGRVGTGFNVDQTWEMKQRLDTRTPFLVEIEVANVTKSGVLRFPVFKGVRTDLEFVDASTSQLASIPRS